MDIELRVNVVSVDVPPAESLCSAYVKHADPASGMAICGVAVVVKVVDGRFGGGRVILTGATASPVSLTQVMTRIEGSGVEAGGTAARGVRDEKLTFTDDLAASGDYRAHLAEVLIERAFAAARDPSISPVPLGNHNE